MGALLPISAGRSSSIAGRTTAAPATAVAAVSVELPLAFALLGLTALLISALWMTAQPALLATYHYNQSVIAFTHLFVLGWICSVVMGSMYQLVPVALETTLYSRRLALIQLGCHLAGFVGMVLMFRAWNLKLVGHFGSLLAVGVGLFVYNIARTVFRAPKRSLTATAILAALAWLSLTVTAGLSIVAAKCSGSGLDAGPTAEAANGWSGAVHALGAFVLRFDTISTMHAHAHLGVVGFFTLLIVGVSYKLIPMFTLSEVRSARRAAASVVLLNLGLAGTFLAVLLRSSWKPVFAVVIILALGFYAVELIAILRARRRRALDWGIKTFLTAIWLAVPLSVIALILSWPGLPANQLTGRLENLYGFLGLVGMVSLAIIGMLYKIVPFLVWYGTYSRQAGLFKVPPLADLYSERLQKVGYGLYLVGLVLVSCGILASQGGWVRCGGALLTTAVLSLVLNVGVMLNHFFHPRLLPLTAANSSRL